MIMEKKEFQVGDVIVKKNWYNTERLVVTRVTKTQAVCEVKRDNGTSYKYKYKKEYSFINNAINLAHVIPVPYIKWNTTEYYVYPKNEK